jgi:hypothetical protein
MSTYFAAVNRGKRSVAIDLGRERGRELLRELAARADVLIENFRPGVTARLGIGYEALAARNPELIYASITGFGSRGPKATEAGTEVIVEAETGLIAMIGTPDGPPVRFGVAMVDIATGATLVRGARRRPAADPDRPRAAARVPAVRDGVQLPRDGDRVGERRPREPGGPLGQRAPLDRALLGVRGQRRGSSSSARSTS